MMLKVSCNRISRLQPTALNHERGCWPKASRAALRVASLIFRLRTAIGGLRSSELSRQTRLTPFFSSKGSVAMT